MEPLKLTAFRCLRLGERTPSYIMLNDRSIVYVIPPVAEGKPGFVNASAIGCLIAAIAAQERLDPSRCLHYVLFAGLDGRFVGKRGSYLYARVQYGEDSKGPYARLGTFFAITPIPCPGAVLAACVGMLGANPVQESAQNDWVLPPRDNP